MKYPKWFPYPVCWVKSVALFVYLGFALRIGWFWGMIGTAAGVKSSAVLLVILPFLLLVTIHHICLGKTKWPWLPGWASWRTALNATIIAPIAWLLAFLLYHPISYEFEAQIIRFESFSYQEYQIDVLWYGAIALVSAAYLYHYDNLVRQSRKYKKPAKRKF